MNYLGHAYLSFGDAALLAGNMIGDHVKGSHILATFPEPVRAGIQLHRRIDTYTDSHPEITAAKQYFRPAYGLYAGAFTDTFMDYFLATDTLIFPEDQDLYAFSQEVYAQLEQHSAVFPESFKAYFQSMKQHNWLYHYGTEAGIQRSVTGLQRRALHIAEIDTAMTLFREHKDVLRQHYRIFIKDIIGFVKIGVKDL